MLTKANSQPNPHPPEKPDESTRDPNYSVRKDIIHFVIIALVLFAGFAAMKIIDSKSDILARISQNITSRFIK